MIHVFLGTKAQLIKMAPIMAELQQRGIPYNFIFSGQHQATIDNIREEFGLKRPDITLYKGKDITGIFQMLIWSVRIIFFSLINRQAVWQGDNNGVVLNHGDTFSTLLGSVLARLGGHKSAHVESGLRSFNLLNPFPEEITRVLTFYLTNIYFAPGEWALLNLKNHRGEKVDTVHNTLLDSLRISEFSVNASSVEIPAEEYAVVSIHRFENIFSRSRFRQIIDLLIQVSDQIPLLFILHKPTEKKLQQYDLMEKLKACPNIELRPRYTYFQFIKLVKAAKLVITDGGSNQEECYYLGKPCILMRNRSERQEGIGKNAVLSNYDSEIVNAAVNNCKNLEIARNELNVSPTQIIVDRLVEL